MCDLPDDVGLHIPPALPLAMLSRTGHSSCSIASGGGGHLLLTSAVEVTTLSQVDTENTCKHETSMPERPNVHAFYCHLFSVTSESW